MWRCTTAGCTQEKGPSSSRPVGPWRTVETFSPCTFRFNRAVARIHRFERVARTVDFVPVGHHPSWINWGLMRFLYLLPHRPLMSSKPSVSPFCRNRPPSPPLTSSTCPVLSKNRGPTIRTLRRSHTSCTLRKRHILPELSSPRFSMVCARCLYLYVRLPVFTLLGLS